MKKNIPAGAMKMKKNITAGAMTMKKYTSALAILAITASPLALAEVSTKSGEASGVIPMPLTAVAAVNAEVSYYPHGANEEGEDDTQPWPITGPWTFSWDSATPDAVDFTGTMVFGNYFTVTDAGTMGGVTRQTFWDYQQQVKGTASWDAATRTLTYDLQPKERDDGQASTYSDSKPATCDKIKGWTAGKACSAFEATSPAMEGLVLNLTFSENLDSVQGTFTLIQFGGDGMTKSITEIDGTLEASLTD
jgi:hypothetical protein